MVELPENHGAAVARNVGVHLAQGEVVIFLDSDGMLEPTHNARVPEALRNRRNDGIYL